jgi:hypothetical protein
MSEPDDFPPDDFHAENFQDAPAPFRHKRIRGKTAFSLTEYGPPVRILHSKTSAKNLKRKAAEALLAANKRLGIVTTAAWVAVRANIEATVQAINDEGTGLSASSASSAGPCAMPHASHCLAKVGTLEAIYCTKCAAHSSGAMNLRGLNIICKGCIPKGFSRVHRLLQLGIIPGPGVNIPPGLSRKRKRCW